MVQPRTSGHVWLCAVRFLKPHIQTKPKPTEKNTVHTTMTASDYSRHIAGGGFPSEILNPPEIWQRKKFGQLILMRIIKIVATRCQIIRQNCTKIWAGALPQTTLGELTVFSQTL